jgi:CRISPR-associated protein Csx3
MFSNVLPAIVLAGPPNCGKSVLAFLLTRELRSLGVAHYLVRAAPDGEGNWFMEGSPSTVQAVRQQHKGKFTEEFVAHMTKRVQRRQVPLLVDMGGKPQGKQWEVLGGCTHSVLLYRAAADQEGWRTALAGLNLFPIAELQSDLHGADRISAHHPVLQGQIAGLDRTQTRTGSVFGALLDRVAGICRYEREHLEASHFRDASHPLIRETELARQIGKPAAEAAPAWYPEDIPLALQLVPSHIPGSIYGRGPVWLAAALATRLAGGSQIFDSHYGWLPIPVISDGVSETVKVQVMESSLQGADVLEFSIGSQFLEPQPAFKLPLVKGNRGVVLSGRLPRWLFAGLARAYAEVRPFVAVQDMNTNQQIVILSKMGEPAVGGTLS